MMGKIATYREALRALDDWEPYLLHESRLPGPRANLELAQAVAEEGSKDKFESYLLYDAQAAPVNTAGEFLAVCGVIGLGRLLAEGDRSVLPKIRECAVDPRWRVREGTAMALQRFGEADMDGLLEEMESWQSGSLLERRAAAAALCEPKLLRQPQQVQRVLEILDRITASLLSETERKSAEFIALRKGLGYCWSVGVAALPETGKAAMEKWLGNPDPDIRWILKENLKKDRLLRMDPDWVQKMKDRV